MPDARPPADLDAERAILGAVLLGGLEALDTARDVGLKGQHFYAPAHELLWLTAERVAMAGHPVDHTTVLAALNAEDKRKVGTLASELITAASYTPFVEVHARTVVDAAVLRALATAGMRVQQLALTAPLDMSRRALERARGELDKVESPEEQDSARLLREIVPDVLDSVERRNSLGHPTGLWELDDILGGGPGPGQLMVVAARPSVGKTTLGVNMAAHSARAGARTVLFSLEMTRAELTQRFLSLESGVPLRRIRSGEVGEDGWLRLAKATAEIDSWPLLIDDQSDMSMADIRARLRKLVRHARAELVVVDYMQLVAPADYRLPREQQVAGISRASKAVAKDFDCPVVMLAQLNRESDKRRGARPLLSDLRESGSIENDADIVVLMHQPQGSTDEMELIVGKNRQGERRTVHVQWEGHIMRVRDGRARAAHEDLWRERLERGER